MAESQTAVAAAFVGNGALAVLKGIAAASTGSAAMLAETFHSIADTGNQVLLFLGLRLGKRPADARHPFGYGKNVYFWAFVVSIILFSLGGAFSIWEALQKFQHPGDHQAASSWWTWGVLGGGFVFEVVSLWVAIRALNQARGPASLREYWRETRDPTLITVLLEDSAALMSLVVAGAGIGLAAATGALVWDALASGVIGLMLVGIAVVLAFESYSLLLGESAPRDIQAAIRRAVVADDAVAGVAALHTLHLGPESLLIALAVEFRPDLPTASLGAAVGRIHDRVKAAVGGVTRPRLIIVEPAGPGADTFGMAG